MSNQEMIKCEFCAEEILPDAKKCKHCGEWVKEQKNILITGNDQRNSFQNNSNKNENFGSKEFGLIGIGTALISLGFIGAFYFIFIFDTTVSVPYMNILGQSFGGGRVNNFGLMQDRQNGIILSSVITIIGLILTLTGIKNNEKKTYLNYSFWIPFGIFGISLWYQGLKNSGENLRRAGASEGEILNFQILIVGIFAIISIISYLKIKKKK